MTDGGENCHGFNKSQGPRCSQVRNDKCINSSPLKGQVNQNCLVVWYMNDKNKIQTFMLEFHVGFISPLHSNDFQLLCSSYIGLHKLRTPYAFPLLINLSLI